MARYGALLLCIPRAQRHTERATGRRHWWAAGDASHNVPLRRRHSGGSGSTPHTRSYHAPVPAAVAQSDVARASQRVQCACWCTDRVNRVTSFEPKLRPDCDLSGTFMVFWRI